MKSEPREVLSCCLDNERLISELGLMVGKHLLV